MSNNKRKSFTFAELLMTVTILGVITALAIPNIIQNINSLTYKYSFINTYGSLVRSNSLILNENGGTFPVPCDGGCLINKFAEKMNFIKVCSSSPQGSCFSDDVRVLSGGTYGSLFSYSAGAILNTGVAIIIDDEQGPGCARVLNSLTNICANFMIDVNGLKEPNTIGKDIFKIWLLPTRFIPYGTNGDGYQDSCTSSGYSCSYEYLINKR